MELCQLVYVLAQLCKQMKTNVCANCMRRLADVPSRCNLKSKLIALL